MERKFTFQSHVVGKGPSRYLTFHNTLRLKCMAFRNSSLCNTLRSKYNAVERSCYLKTTLFRHLVTRFPKCADDSIGAMDSTNLSCRLSALVLAVRVQIVREAQLVIFRCELPSWPIVRYFGPLRTRFDSLFSTRVFLKHVFLPLNLQNLASSLFNFVDVVVERADLFPPRWWVAAYVDFSEHVHLDHSCERPLRIFA